MPEFTRTVTLHRYLRAATEPEALRSAQAGVTVASTITNPHGVVESMSCETTVAEPYEHVSEPGVWHIASEYVAVLQAFDSVTASEAAHLLVSVIEPFAGRDVFEFEVDVDEPVEVELRRSA